MSDGKGTGLQGIVGLALLIVLAALLVPQARAMAPEDALLRRDIQSVAQVTALLLERLPGARYYLQSALRASHAERGQIELAALLDTFSQASEAIPEASSWTRVPVRQLDKAAQLADEHGLVVRVPSAALEAILNGAAPRYLLLDPIWQGAAEGSGGWEGYDLHSGQRVRLHRQVALASPTLILSLPGQSTAQDLESEAVSAETSYRRPMVVRHAAQSER